MDRNLIAQLPPLVDHLNGWRGALVEIVELITRVPGSFDRHVTTSSRFVMRLETVVITFSGASLTLLGAMNGHPADYQASCERLEAPTFGPDEVVLLERFGNVVERRTVIRLLTEETGL